MLDDYEQVSATGLERLTGMATLEIPVPLGDAGTYPAAILPAAAFDGRSVSFGSGPAKARRLP